MKNLRYVLSDRIGGYASSIEVQQNQIYKRCFLETTFNDDRSKALMWWANDDSGKDEVKKFAKIFHCEVVLIDLNEKYRLIV